MVWNLAGWGTWRGILGFCHSKLSCRCYNNAIRLGVAQITLRHIKLGLRHFYPDRRCLALLTGLVCRCLLFRFLRYFENFFSAEHILALQQDSFAPFFRLTGT